MKWKKKQYYFTVVCSWCDIVCDTLQWLLSFHCLTKGSLCSFLPYHGLVSVFFQLKRKTIYAHTHTQKKGKHSERKLEWQSKGRILLSSCQTVMRSFGALCSLFFWSISLARVVEADWQPGAAVPHLCSLTLSLCLHVYSSCSLYSAWSAMAKNPDNKDDDAFYSCTHRHAT